MDQHYKENYYLSDGAKEIWKMDFKRVTDQLKSVPKERCDLDHILITCKEGKKDD